MISRVRESLLHYTERRRSGRTFCDRETSQYRVFSQYRVSPESEHHHHPTPRGYLAAATVNMDIVLELFDTFVLDSVYATLLPAKSPTFSANATYSSAREAPTGYLPTKWEYAPASDYFSLEPSKYA